MNTLEKTALSEGVKREESRPRRVCFVCTGNTCRSPMAAAVANHLAKEALSKLPQSVRAYVSPDWEAYSAGILANEGDPIAFNAVLALEDAGILPDPNRDYHRHTAHRLTEKEATQYDRLVGLSREHALALLMQFPALASRISCFPTDIPDPFGGSAADYRICLSAITDGVRSMLFGDSEGEQA
jgi:protein-tyrosine phosphatase